jgi:hypothetical protein
MSIEIRDVVQGILGLMMGCSSPKEVKQDATPPKEEGPKCDEFAKDKPHSMVDQDSFDTMHILWSGDVAKAHAGNWHREARIFFGATTRIFGTACVDPSTVDGKTKEYQDGIKIFFEKHYAERAKASEDGILVLIGGIAPESVLEDSFTAAVKAAVGADSSQKDFAEVLAGCYHFNKATEQAMNRFTDKASGVRLSAADKAVARAELTKAEELIAPYIKLIDEGRLDELNQKLDDRQQEILLRLRDAIDGYKRTLGNGGRLPPVATGTKPPPVSTGTVPPPGTATATATSTGGKTVPNPF